MGMTFLSKPFACACGERDPAAYYPRHKGKCKRCFNRKTVVRIGGARKSSLGIVYFAQVVNEDRFIKIGFTRRAFELRCRNGRFTDCPYPIELLATSPGYEWEEATLHTHLADHRLTPTGEWFTPSREVLSIVHAARSRPIAEVLRLIKRAG